MKPVRRAVIDVGTNSVKLLVADVAGVQVQPVVEKSKQTRLGHGFYETHRLQAEAIAATAEAVARFAGEARQCEAQSIRIVATSAARDAANADELTTRIERSASLKVEIISGEQEADWVFAGVSSDERFAGRRLLLLDVGGGSTELILGSDKQKEFSASFALGSVRLMEQLPHGDPPRPEELAACRQCVRSFLKAEVAPKLREGRTEEGRTELVGTGGTATILARMEGQMSTFERQRIEEIRVSLERMRWHMERLWSLPLAERERIVGLPKNRADIILNGAAIYEGIMEEFGFAELSISTRGLRFAVVMDGGGE